MRAFALASVCGRVCNMELNFLSLCFSNCHKNCSIQADIRIFSAPCRAFTITAVAQLCVLGTMWIFGCFQFGENTIIMSYLFTIFGSLQGVMLFVMHCLFSKQVGHNPLSKTTTKNQPLVSINTLYWFLGKRGVCKSSVKTVCTKKKELHRVQILKLQQSTGKDYLVSYQFQ